MVFGFERGGSEGAIRRQRDCVDEAGRQGEEEELWTLQDVAIVKRLRGVYLGNIGYEFMHSPSKTERLWFSRLLESQTLPSPDERHRRPEEAKNLRAVGS
ncbi:hypothetical protein MD484_g9005, partial [Candolleomyces efflorescens]